MKKHGTNLTTTPNRCNSSIPKFTSIPQHKLQPNVLLRPADDHLLHERREYRRVKLQALLLPGQHAHEQRYPI